MVPQASGRRGFVYILSNPAMPGLLKIGCTGRTAGDRARELSSATGVPAPFVVEWEWPVSDWRAVEALTHAKLARLRSSRWREFFACSVPRARRAIRRASGAYLRPRWLRLLIGPRVRVVATGPVWRRHQVDLLPVLLLLLGVAVVGLVAVCKPHPPAWLPPSVAGPVRFIEAHSPAR